MYKKCTRCKKQKPTAEFPPCRLAYGRVGSLGKCRACKNAYEREYYRTNQKRQDCVRSNKRANNKITQEFVRQYLLSHACVDCGETDPVVLEFDHVRGKKRANISKLKKISLEAVKNEIKKCVVRCANCHRRKTAKQFNWGYPPA